MQELWEALVTGRSVAEMGLMPGKEVFASFKASAVKVIPGAKGKR